MQRTLPPPQVSMVGMGTASTVSVQPESCANTSRLERPPGGLRHDEHARVPERLVPGAELEHVAGEVLELRSDR